MPLNTEELLKAAEMVAECREMKVTMKYSLLGAGIAALSALAGGLIGGPRGLAAGAVCGGAAAYSATKDKFRSVVEILREDMTITQKEKLAYHLQQALKDLDITDAVKLFMLINNRGAPLLIIYEALKSFLESDMRLSVMSN